MVEENENNILYIIYYERDNELCCLNADKKEENKEILKENENNAKDLEIALNNLPDCFEEVSKNIKECVEKKIESERELTGCFTKKYYEAGFSDAVKLILNEVMQ